MKSTAELLKSGEIDLHGYSYDLRSLEGRTFSVPVYAAPDIDNKIGVAVLHVKNGSMVAEMDFTGGPFSSASIAYTHGLPSSVVFLQ